MTRHTTARGDGLVVHGLLLALCGLACSDRASTSLQDDADDEPRIDLDLALPDDSDQDAATDIDTADQEAAIDGGGSDLSDGGVAGAMCVISVATASRGETECAISPRTMLGCEHLSRCWCGHVLGADAPADELERCADSYVVPRGAITLADYCAYSGTSSDAVSLPALWERIRGDPLPIDTPFVEVARSTFSAECDEVAAYTLWGEEPSWNLSVGEAGASFTNPPALLEDYTLDGEPLIRLVDMASASLAEATLELTASGRQRLDERLVEAGDDFVGRSFLIHTDAASLTVGAVVSATMSSTREGLVIVIEEVIEAGSAVVTLHEGYPPSGPAELDYLASGALAAAGVLFDRACISSCGCNPGWACRAGQCIELDAGCASDADCCLGRCSGAGSCEGGT